jgi:malate synthase
VKADKMLEVQNGHDGTWVAHPGLVKTAMDIFNQYMTDKNQISNKREDVKVTAQDLLQCPSGTITEKGLRENINIGILYIESWLRGNGAAAIYHLMEDAATAEISRTQVWQWLHTQSILDDGRQVTTQLYQSLKDEEIEHIKSYVGTEAYQHGRFEEAIKLFDQLVLQPEYVEFLTLPAYQLIQ